MFFTIGNIGGNTYDLLNQHFGKRDRVTNPNNLQFLF
jgi:hypothetical protein